MSRRQYIMKRFPGAILLDCLDEAILGVRYQRWARPAVAYDVDKTIEVLMRDRKLTQVEAREWVLHHEEKTRHSQSPVFVERFRDESRE